MNLWLLIRSAAPTANILAVISLALLTLKILILNGYAAPVHIMHDLGVLMDSILASVVASYVFYLIVVHLHETNEIAITRPYIAKHSARVVGLCNQQLVAYSAASGVPLSFESLTQQTLEHAFSKLNPQEDSPMLFLPQKKPATWLQYLEHYGSKSRQTIAQVFSQMKYLDADLVARLATIDDCSHFDSLELVRSGVTFRNADLVAWAPAFYGYVVACRSLDELLRANASARAA